MRLAAVARVAALLLATATTAEQCPDVNATLWDEKTLYISPHNASEGMIVFPNCSNTKYIPTELVASEFDNVPGPLTQLNCSETDIDVMTSYPLVNLLYIDSTSIVNYDFSKDIQLLKLVMSWNTILSLDDLVFPPNLRYLDLGGNELQQITDHKIPTSVRTLILDQNAFTNMNDIALPDTLEHLSLLSSSLESLNFSLPANLEELHLDGSHIPIIERVNFTDNLSVISCIKCKTTTFRGVRLSPKLSKLYKWNLDGNVMTEFEIRESDKLILLNLSETSFNGAITQAACAEPSATVARFLNSFNVCVIPDGLFDSKYASTQHNDNTPPPPAETTKAGISTAVIVIIAVLGSLVAVIVGAFASRRFLQRQNTNETSTGNKTLSLHPMGTTGSTHSSREGYLENDIRNDDAIIPFRIAQEEIQILRLVATGGYGIVHYGRFRGREVAVKQLHQDKSRERSLITIFMDEIRLCTKLEHPKIVEFIGVSWSTLVDLAVVLEFMAGGDLRAALYRDERQPCPENWFHASTDLKSKCVVAQDVIEAVVYLHSLDTPIIHRDLKARNVLLNDDGGAKLSDFGTSRELVLNETMTGDIGTVAWISPEVLRGERYTEKADIYSFGVLLVELDLCARPYSGLFESPQSGAAKRQSPIRSNTQIALQVSTGKLQPQVSRDCPDSIQRLVVMCLAFDANDRPSAIAIHYELQKIRCAKANGIISD